MQLFALIVKEWKLLLRDWHALLLLFVMPAAFILVMSFAMQKGYAEHEGVRVHYYLVDQDSSSVSRAFLQQLAAIPEFKRVPSKRSIAALKARVKRSQVQFLVIVPKGFGNAMLDKHPKPEQMLAGPDVEPAVYQLFVAALRGALGHTYLQHLLAPVQTQLEISGGNGLDAAGKLLEDHSLYEVDGHSQRPSSVQQSVPAWLLFAMFFIALPISTTWVQERQQGTYARLRSMGLGAGALLGGKLLSYIVINLLQVVLMIAIGVFVVPWLGGDMLTLGHAPLALCLMALAVSFASVAYALLIANLVSTSEQATMLTGVANLLMAAIGGIMVPSFVMPPLMQALSNYSPMAWGLQGFLDIFLRQGGISMVLPQAGLLSGFGIGCLLLSGWLLNKKQRK